MTLQDADLAQLIQDLGRAVTTAPCDGTRCRAVEQALVDAASPDLLPPELRQPDADHYARHLIYREPQGKFSMIAMVWGPGQSTPIHDHGGLWCVECVLQGRIEVRSYRPVDHPEDGRVGFTCAEVIGAGFGESGHLIPPLDHHVLANPHDDVAVTLHVYGGDLVWCRAYVPHDDGGYVGERLELMAEQRMG